jgi:hypothetical protein
MESERSKEIQRALAGFLTAGGCIVVFIGVILVAGAITAQKFYADAVTIPPEIRATIDNGWRNGIGALVLGFGLVIGGWLWHHDVAERRLT